MMDITSRGTICRFFDVVDMMDLMWQTGGLPLPQTMGEEHKMVRRVLRSVVFQASSSAQARGGECDSSFSVCRCLRMWKTCWAFPVESQKVCQNELWICVSYKKALTMKWTSRVSVDLDWKTSGNKYEKVGQEVDWWDFVTVLAQINTEPVPQTWEDLAE